MPILQEQTQQYRHAFEQPTQTVSSIIQEISSIPRSVLERDEWWIVSNRWIIQTEKIIRKWITVEWQNE